MFHINVMENKSMIYAIVNAMQMDRHIYFAWLKKYPVTCPE